LYHLGIFNNSEEEEMANRERLLSRRPIYTAMKFVKSRQGVNKHQCALEL